MHKGKLLVIAAGCITAIAATLVIAMLTRPNPAADTAAFWLRQAEREGSLIGMPYYSLEIAELRAEGGDVERALASGRKVFAGKKGIVPAAIDSARDLLADTGIAAPQAPQQKQGRTERDFLVSIAIALVRSGDLTGARAVAAKASVVPGPDYTLARAYIAIAKAQASTGDLSGALATAKLVRQDYMPYDHHVASKLLAVVHAEAGNVAAAQAEVETIPPRDRFETCGEVAAIFGRRGNTQGYTLFIGLMQAAAKVPPYTQNEAYTNREMAIACAGAGDMEGARTAVNSIPDSRRIWECDNAAMWCDWRGFDKAARFFWQMTIDETQKMADSSDLVAAIVAARAGLGDIEGARASVDQVKQPWQGVARRRIAAGMAKAGRFNELREWISSLPTAQERVSACVEAARELIKKEREAKKRPPAKQSSE